MNTNVDTYFTEGCGRCPMGGTPQCKVHRWSKELEVLRKIILACGLTEESKWGQPCYTLGKSNVLLLSAFKEYCAISFFKGVLLKDPKSILVQQTNNVQSSRQIRITNIQEVNTQKSNIINCIYEAIEIEKSGMKVVKKKISEIIIPEEFQNVLNSDSVIKDSFEALTPGRQKGYLLFFSQPKQSKTRVSRIEKSIPKILDGLGLNDR
ncbi:MAG: DUF1801 domain-containing protein [Spirochaetaceae bacterium]